MGSPLKIPSGLDKPGQIIGIGLFGLIFAGVGLAFVFFLGVRPWWQTREAQSWMQTPCRVLHSGIVSHSGKSATYSLDIAYTYQVAGHAYESDRYDFTTGSDDARAWRAAVMRANPPGTLTVCYVDPQDPAQAVMSRGFKTSVVIWAVGGLFSLVGLSIVAGAGWHVLRRMKFGQSEFELGDAPAPLGGMLAGTVNLSRRVEPAEGFAVKLACIHRVVTGAGKNQSVSETPLWEESKQVIPDTSMSIPVSFALPEDGAEASAVSPSNRTFWRLDVTGRVPGVGYAAQFEVPVAHEELSVAQKTAAGQQRAEDEREYAQFQLPAHSRIRVRETGGGKEFYFPACRNLGLVVFLTVFGACWSGIVWFLFHSSAPMIFGIVFGLFDLPILMFWAGACFGSVRVRAENGQLTITRRLLLLGSTRAVPATEVKEIKLGVGATMGNTTYYNIEVVRQNGMKLTVGYNIPDAHEAHWLALEMAKCAGVGQ